MLRRLEQLYTVVLLRHVHVNQILVRAKGLAGGVKGVERHRALRVPLARRVEQTVAFARRIDSRHQNKVTREAGVPREAPGEAAERTERLAVQVALVLWGATGRA